MCNVIPNIQDIMKGTKTQYVRVTYLPWVSSWFIWFCGHLALTRCSTMVIWYYSIQIHQTTRYSKFTGYFLSWMIGASNLLSKTKRMCKSKYYQSIEIGQLISDGICSILFPWCLFSDFWQGLFCKIHYVFPTKY